MLKAPIRNKLFLIYHAIVRPTKTMNNLLKDGNGLTFKLILQRLKSKDSFFPMETRNPTFVNDISWKLLKNFIFLKLIQFLLALFINLVSLTTIKKAFTNRCIYGFWSNWQKNLERNLSRLVQYSTVLLLMCLSHRNHDQKKGNPHCLYLLHVPQCTVLRFGY